MKEKGDYVKKQHLIILKSNGIGFCLQRDTGV